MIAYHCIFGMYGFWLPNDPRGSGSDYVAVWELFRYGAATKTNSRRSVAAKPHDVAQRFAAKEVLLHPPVKLTSNQRELAIAGFARAATEGLYRVHACAIMPDHVHLVVGAHQRNIRQIVGHLKSRATTSLKEAGHWPDPERPIWGEHGWDIFLDDVAAVERAIAYVEDNPRKEGLPLQKWPFVQLFDVRTAISMSVPQVKRKTIGGAALRSQQEARRKRRG